MGVKKHNVCSAWQLVNNRICRLPLGKYVYFEGMKKVFQKICLI